VACCLLFQVGCHPLHSMHNVMGRAVQGPALIQIYEVVGSERPAQQAAVTPAGAAQQATKVEEGAEDDGNPALSLPALAMGIAHNGGLTWHLEWCPDPELADELAGGAGGPAGPLPRCAKGGRTCLLRMGVLGSHALVQVRCCLGTVSSKR
jgi:hypothetical protein